MLKKIIRSAAAVLLSIMMTVPVFAAEKSYTYQTDRTWTKISDNSWTMDLDGDGHADVTLTTTTNDQGQAVWTYEFAVEDDAQQYYAYETMLGLPDGVTYPDGYSSEGSDGKLAIEADPGQVDSKTHSYTITNTKEHEVLPINSGTGSLKIAKNVDGTMRDPEQKFVFHIALTAPSSSGIAFTAPAEIFGDTAFTVTSNTSASANVTLRNGETKTIVGIPAGVTYVITETPAGASAADYTVESKTGDTGTIAKDTVSESAWTNKSSYVKDSETVSFTVTKKVSGAAEKDDAVYPFHVLLENLGNGSTYTYTVGTTSTTYKADAKGSADVSLSLKKDETVSFNDIPTGTEYQVMEEGGVYEASYEIKDANNNGMIVSMNGTGKVNENLSTAKETAEADEAVNITFTNHYPSVQNLTVRKKMEDGYSKKDQTFSFTVEFSGLKDGDVIESPVGRIVPDENGEAMKSFMLTAGKDKTGEIVFRNIPVNTQYKVTETGNKCKPSYEITTVDTYGNEKEGTYVLKSAEGSMGKDLSTGGRDEDGAEINETVEENQSDTVTFTNSIRGLNFAIFKQNVGDPVPDAGYTIFKYNGKELEKADTRTTDANGFAGWTALDTGVYVLEETTVPAGYTRGEDILFVIQDDGTVRYAETEDRDQDAAAVAKDTVKQNSMQVWKVYKQYEDQNSGETYTSFLVSDARLPKLPTTGSIGTTVFFGIGAAVMVIAVVIIVKKTRG